ncbi:ThiF family adenylyltransferase [Solitalea sp. MAHUQ-68]|uniref:ThiF family adenylyltransferase n=1 Tax=Solitalea agri TaxID=2953739 RepID=A0A9X2JCM8_9SPHI|nr:ThiF family adenylyltransferase [Solitalea agri]MCO4291970.1 ThiF family adenylyltransferase [Solitalea agri]
MNLSVDIPQLLRYKLRETNVRNNECQPEFFRLSNALDAEKLYHLLQYNSSIAVYDEIHAQLKELMKIRNPDKLLPANVLDQLIKDHLKGNSSDTYGVWVFYPWINKVVHLLDENEFIEVRTARNKLKITEEEQNLLRNKKVGIIGLSVGQSVAVTMAMERVCGELRLADFDALELGNLNRLRAGVQQLSVPKVICAAREIAEIDPFIKVKVYKEGLSIANMAEFLGEGEQRLNLLVEVCDSFEMKILSRIEARKRQIPVVMETNDRGMLDIERFDLEPQRMLMHGMVPQLEGESTVIAKKLEGINPQERMQYLSQMIGMENLSERMLYSLQSLGKTINGWPQLASGAVLGGAIVTHSCRKILLDSFRSSGRYFIDLEKIINDMNKS